MDICQLSLRILPLAFSIVVATGPADSQSLPSLSGLERMSVPNNSDLRLPELPLSSAPVPTLELPPLAPQIQTEPQSNGPLFKLKGVAVKESTVFSVQEIASVTGNFVDRRISAADLEELRQRLTRLYVEHGYINSGAVLPDQDVQDGIVTFQIIEGRITDIAVVGADGWFSDYVHSRLALDTGPPFRVEEISNRLYILSQDPSIKRITLDVQPGAAPGEAKLAAKVEEQKPLTVTMGFSNSQSPAVGDLRGDSEAELRNYLGFGEAVKVRYGMTGGVKDGGITVSAPVTPWDTVVHVMYDRNASNMVQANLAAIGVQSNSATHEIGITQPLYRSPDNSVSAGLSFDNRQSYTYLLGERFSFSPGESDGMSNVNVVRFSQEWENRSPDYAIVFRSTFSKGLLALGSTNTGKPNGQFTTWFGQSRGVIKVLDDYQLVLRGDVQLSDRPLFSMEQFSLGGLNSVRGYRENEIVADDGTFLSAELRVPLTDFSLPSVWGTFDESDKGIVSLAPFYDEGHAWSQAGNTSARYLLRSIGIGIRLDIADALSGQIYYGRALHRVATEPDHNIQDDGIHFQISTTMRF